MGAANAQWAKIPIFATLKKLFHPGFQPVTQGFKGQTPSGAFVQVIKIAYFSFCAKAAAAFEEKCITPTH